MMRLNQYVAACTGLSRRKADEAITAGLVKVNQKRAELGQSIDPDKARVTYQGELLVLQKKIVLAFYKPAGYLTTRSDPEGRKTIYDLLPQKYHHLDPVGRLDKDSSGLLLLTNDGELLHQLTHPKFQHRKTYRVKVNRPLTEAILSQLSAGVLLQPENQIAQMQIQDVTDPKTIQVVLKTGMNRQIRRSFESLGYTVTQLKRTAMAGIQLGSLRPTAHRLLKPFELKHCLKNNKPPKKPIGKR